jgi:hypothetical protein
MNLYSILENTVKFLHLHDDFNAQLLNYNDNKMMKMTNATGVIESVYVEKNNQLRVRA